MKNLLRELPLRLICAGLLGMFLVCGAASAQAGDAGCILKKQFYTCDRAQFQPMLAAAKTVQVEAGSRDKVAAGKLRDLATSLGKTVPPAGEPSDLTFSLIPLDSDGVLIGPAGTELAVLRVYGPTIDGRRGNLMWAETFFGQPDMSWPAVVQSVIQQFRAGFRR